MGISARKRRCNTNIRKAVCMSGFLVAFIGTCMESIELMAVTYIAGIIMMICGKAG